MEGTNWSFKQEFKVRLSTLTLLSFPALIVIALIAQILPRKLGEVVMLLPGAVLTEFWLPLAVLACIFSLSLLIASAIRKRPQIQFLVELTIGALLVLFSPIF